VNTSRKSFRRRSSHTSRQQWNKSRRYVTGARLLKPDSRFVVSEAELKLDIGYNREIAFLMKRSRDDRVECLFRHRRCTPSRTIEYHPRSGVNCPLADPKDCSDLAAHRGRSHLFHLDLRDHTIHLVVSRRSIPSSARHNQIWTGSECMRVGRRCVIRTRMSRVGVFCRMVARSASAASSNNRRGCLEFGRVSGCLSFAGQIQISSLCASTWPVETTYARVSFVDVGGGDQ
jgi:hypothetical protein